MAYKCGRCGHIQATNTGCNLCGGGGNGMGAWA